MKKIYNDLRNLLKIAFTVVIALGLMIISTGNIQIADAYSAGDVIYLNGASSDYAPASGQNFTITVSLTDFDGNGVSGKAGDGGVNHGIYINKIDDKNGLNTTTTFPVQNGTVWTDNGDGTYEISGNITGSSVNSPYMIELRFEDPTNINYQLRAGSITVTVGGSASGAITSLFDSAPDYVYYPSGSNTVVATVRLLDQDGSAHPGATYDANQGTADSMTIRKVEDANGISISSFIQGGFMDNGDGTYDVTISYSGAVNNRIYLARFEYMYDAARNTELNTTFAFEVNDTQAPDGPAGTPPSNPGCSECADDATIPALNIDQPDGTIDTVTVGDNYGIQYDLSDSDDTVTVAFYYDSNNSGPDGTAITGACATAAEGNNATCTWDTTGMSPGSYYIYGITNDGTNPDVSDYSSGQITINPIGYPALNIDQPDGTADTVTVGGNYSIQYDLADSDDTVTAAFYYDSNNSGSDGTAITGACATAAEGNNATCTWDTTGMSPGSYYVYGITNDGTNPDVSDYSSGQITISPLVATYYWQISDGSSYGGMTTNWSQSCGNRTDNTSNITTMTTSTPSCSSTGVRDDRNEPASMILMIKTSSYDGDYDITGVSVKTYAQDENGGVNLQYELGYVTGGSFTPFSGSVTETDWPNGSYVIRTTDISSLSGTAPTGSFLALRITKVNSNNRFNISSGSNNGNTIELQVAEVAPCSDPDPSTITISAGQSVSGDPFDASAFIGTTGDVGTFEYKVTSGSGEAGFDQLDDFAGLSNGTRPGFGDWTGVNGSDGTMGWVALSGATGSGSTGPAVGNPGPYVYLESSGSGQIYGDDVTAGSSQYIESNVVDASHYSLSFTFDWNMNVNLNTNASLHVDAWNGSSWDLDVSGGAINTGNNNDTWVSESAIDLSSYTNSTLKLRIRYVVGSVTVYNNDFAVDNLRIYGPHREVVCTDWTSTSSVPTTTSGGSSCGDYTTGTYTLYARGTDPDCSDTVTSTPASRDFTWNACTETEDITLVVSDTITGTTMITAGGSAAGKQVRWREDGGSWSGWQSNGSNYTPSSCGVTTIDFEAQGTGFCSTIAASDSGNTQSDSDAATLTITSPTVSSTVSSTQTIQVLIGTEGAPGTMNNMLVTTSGSACDVTSQAMTWNGASSRWEYDWDTSVCGTVTPETGTTIDISGEDPDCGSTKNASQVTNITVDNTCSPAVSITGFSPTQGTAGSASVTIDGSGFGASQGTGTVKFFNNQTAAITSWSDTQIMATAPAGAASGAITVQSDAACYKISGSNFRVCTRIDPDITFIPSAASIKAGQNQAYTVRITNNDQYCADSNFSYSLGTETGDTGSFTLPSTFTDASTGTLASGGTYDTSLTVAADAGSTVGHQLSTTIGIAADGNHSAVNTSVTATIIPDWSDNSTFLHNANRFGDCTNDGFDGTSQTDCEGAGGTWTTTTKWSGNWGLGSGKYGGISCETCHAETTTNIKRIKTSITAPDTGDSFPGQAAGKTLSFLNPSTDFGDPASNSWGICEYCHSTTSYHKYNQQAAHNGQGDCTDCHTHKSGFLGSGDCITCHTNVQGGNRRQIAGTGGDIDSGKTFHHVSYTTLDIATCEVCHDQASHKSNADPGVLLNDPDGGAAITYTGTASQLTSFCLNCHDGDNETPFTDSGDSTNMNTGNLNIETAWTATYNHSADAECVDCHGDSGGDGSTTAPYLNGHGGDNTQYLQGTGATAQAISYDTCVTGSCHGSGGSATVDMTVELSGTGGKHPIDGAVTPKSNIIANTMFVNDMTVSSTISCSDCHGTNGGGPRGPHGSSFQYILKGVDTTIVSGGSPTNSDINNVTTKSIVERNFCINCHDASVYSLGSAEAYKTDLYVPDRANLSALAHYSDFREKCGATHNDPMRTGAKSEIGCTNCHAGFGRNYGAHSSSYGTADSAGGWTAQGGGFMNGDSWTQAPDSGGSCYATTSATSWTSCTKGAHD